MQYFYNLMRVERVYMLDFTQLSEMDYAYNIMSSPSNTLYLELKTNITIVASISMLS